MKAKKYKLRDNLQLKLKVPSESWFSFLGILPQNQVNKLQSTSIPEILQNYPKLLILFCSVESLYEFCSIFGGNWQ